MNNKKSLTVGELKKYLKVIPDSTELYIGYGENVNPLRYLCEYNGGLMFHSDLYNIDNATEHNINTVLSIANYDKV